MDTFQIRLKKDNFTHLWETGWDHWMYILFIHCKTFIINYRSNKWNSNSPKFLSELFFKNQYKVNNDKGDQKWQFCSVSSSNHNEISWYHFQKTKNSKQREADKGGGRCFRNSLALFVTAFEDSYDRHDYDFPLRSMFNGRLVIWYIFYIYLHNRDPFSNQPTQSSFFLCHCNTQW